MGKVEIITPRLVLRTPTPEDAGTFQQAKAEMWPELQLWMSWSYDDQLSLDATRAYIDFAQNKTPYECLLGFRRDNGAFVIASGLGSGQDPDTYSTGYWVAKSQLGQGFATEATNAQIRYAFNELKAKKITLSYYEGNDKSINVIRKLGFTPTETVKGGHKRCSDGTPLDVHKFMRTHADHLPALEVSWS